jgi:hypothetical protein
MREPTETSAESDYCALQARVGAIIARHKTESRINPAWIATEAINEIDRRRFDIRSMPHFYRAAHLALRQIARELLGMPDEEGRDGKTPDEILAEGEAQLRHKASCPPKGQIEDKLVLLRVSNGTRSR